MQKRNPITHKYEPYEVPKDRHSPLHCDDLDEEINCTGCGDKFTYGESYTSRHIHNPYGLGYPVCRTCYEQEVSTIK